MNITLDPAGIKAILRSAAIKEMVLEAAEKIAHGVEEQGIQVGAFRGGQGRIPLPVEVRDETTDRATAAVVLAHPAGIAAQAKYGALTRAASAAGLEVRSA